MHSRQETRLWPIRIRKGLTELVFFFPPCLSNEHSKCRHHFASQVLHHRDKDKKEGYAHDYTFANLWSHINLSLFPQHWRSWSRISSIQASFHLLPICNDFTPHAHANTPQNLILTDFPKAKGEGKKNVCLLTSLKKENQMGDKDFSKLCG